MSNEQQKILLATDKHEGNGTPAEQWLTIQSAGAFLLSQWLPSNSPPKEAGWYHMKQKEYDKFVDLLSKFCRALGWSKWDFQSTWYVKQVLPLGEDPPDVEPPSMEELEKAEKLFMSVSSLPGAERKREQVEMYLRQIATAKEKRKQWDAEHVTASNA